MDHVHLSQGVGKLLMHWRAQDGEGTCPAASSQHEATELLWRASRTMNVTEAREALRRGADVNFKDYVRVSISVLFMHSLAPGILLHFNSEIHMTPSARIKSNTACMPKTVGPAKRTQCSIDDCHAARNEAELQLLDRTAKGGRREAGGPREQRREIRRG